MAQSFSKALDTPTGSIVVSIILGLGLAAVFRRACKDKQCIVVKGPNVEDVKKFFYKVNDDCFKYTPVVTDCKQ